MPQSNVLNIGALPQGATCHDIINAIPAGFYLKDKDMKFIMANARYCSLLGYKCGEVEGKTIFDLLPKEKASEYIKGEQQLAEGKMNSASYESPITNPSGEIRWISISNVILKSNGGEIEGVIGLTSDITDYHVSRERLMQSDKLVAIGTLAAGVAHEINNPMGYINSNLNTMKKYLKKIIAFVDSVKENDAEKAEGIRDIVTDFDDAIDESIEGALRVRKIVADLKSFSRVDRAEKEYADINEGIESTLNIVWNELKYKCKVVKNYGTLPDLFCIPNQLNQVFMNLLVNAGQAITGNDGEIKITTWADEKNVYVSIADNGCGINQENMSKIFEPFFTTKEVGRGTGLGLSLTFDIIKKHHGMIDVKSEIGRGTEFIVELPLKGIDDV
jgi:PAS domain S-box-containing protein